VYLQSNGRLSFSVKAPIWFGFSTETRTVTSTASFNDKDDDSSSSGALPPPPKHPELNPVNETNRKLAEIEDLEIAEMLDRVGGRLQELRVAGEDDERAIVEFPDKEDFRDETGSVDWAAFATAVSYSPHRVL
jgi:hypothetical protein